MSVRRRLLGGGSLRAPRRRRDVEVRAVLIEVTLIHVVQPKSTTIQITCAFYVNSDIRVRGVLICTTAVSHRVIVMLFLAKI